MNETMLAVLGFATVITIIVLLLKNVTVPALAFVGVSTVASAILVLTGTFTVKEMGDFIKAGVSGVHGTAALFINYPGAKKQNRIIKSHSGPALMMASTILSAGVFLGVMEQSDIMMNMANVLAGLIPQSMGRMLPIIIGLLAVPLTLFFDTDSFFFGLMPILISIAETFGIRPEHIAIVMVVCRNCATFISPVVPATFLGIGLAGVEIKDHIKRCFFWIWGVSIICMISGLLLGVIKI